MKLSRCIFFECNGSWLAYIPSIVQSILAKGLSINLPYKAVDDGDFLPFYAIHYSFLPHYNFVHQLYEQFTVKLK